MFQRLQQRMNRKKVVPESEPELSSFYPDTEDGTAPPPARSSDLHLDVCEVTLNIFVSADS